MKFDMLVIGLEENAVSINDLAQRKSFFGGHPTVYKLLYVLGKGSVSCAQPTETPFNKRNR